MFDSENKRRHIKAGRPSAGKQTAECVTVTALPSDQHFLMQQDTKGREVSGAISVTLLNPGQSQACNFCSAVVKEINPF